MELKVGEFTESPLTGRIASLRSEPFARGALFPQEGFGGNNALVSVGADETESLVRADNRYEIGVDVRLIPCFEKLHHIEDGG